MIDKALMRRIIAIRKQAGSIIDSMESVASAELVSLLDGVTQTMERLLTAGTIDEETVAVLARLVDGAQERGADIIADLAGGIFDVSLESTVRIADQFSTLSPRRLASMTQTFSDGFRVDLLVDGHARWYEELGRTALAPHRGLRNGLFAAQAEGRPLDQAVAAMLKADPGISSLPQNWASENLSYEARARMVIRTESTRVDNIVSVGFAESAGITKFANVGVGDERQSEVCRIASEADPMTIEQWTRYRQNGLYIGTAPRHPNCRCQLMGVFTGFEPSESLLREAGVIQ